MSTSMPLRLWVRAPRMVIWSIASTLGINGSAEAGAGWVSVGSCVRATLHYRGGWGCVASGVARRVSGTGDNPKEETRDSVLQNVSGFHVLASSASEIGVSRYLS